MNEITRAYGTAARAMNAVEVSAQPLLSEVANAISNAIAEVRNTEDMARRIADSIYGSTPEPGHTNGKPTVPPSSKADELRMNIDGLRDAIVALHAQVRRLDTL